MQSSTMNTVITRSVKVALDPDGRQMQRFERNMEAALTDALQAWRRRLFRGVTAENISVLLSRLDDREIGQPMRDALEAQLLAVAEAGGQRGLDHINELVFGVKRADLESGIGLLWDLVNTAVADWARQHSYFLMYANVYSLTATMKKRLGAEIAAFTQNGFTINKLAENIAPLFGEDRAKVIAITEVTRAYARGNMLAWQQQDIIKRHRWNTANDELVCPICGPLNGMVTEIGGRFGGGYLDSPPAHPRCRCWLTPVVELG